MADTADTLATWLEQSDITAHRLTEQQQAVLEAAFRFRQTVGADYYSTRLLGHFLLHCQSGLKVAAIARLLGISRPTASEQQGLSSQQVVRQAHHRMAVLAQTRHQGPAEPARRARHQDIHASKLIRAPRRAAPRSAVR